MNDQAALLSTSCERDCFEISIALRYLLYLEFERLPMTVMAEVDIKYVSTLAATGLVSAKFFPPPCNVRRYERTFDARIIEITDVGREEIVRLKEEYPACANAISRFSR